MPFELFADLPEDMDFPDDMDLPDDAFFSTGAAPGFSGFAGSARFPEFPLFAADWAPAIVAGPKTSAAETAAIESILSVMNVLPEHFCYWDKTSCAGFGSSRNGFSVRYRPG
ncbi:hypothetical protein [Methylopila sp. M107]|uniref:hypothetical protein n=1 Tax=Methylopila sp. M107 TaxID=1101190 RepID=UPI0012DE9221|nr:hypothetical protein [Methylopila sp. M107]